MARLAVGSLTRTCTRVYARMHAFTYARRTERTSGTITRGTEWGKWGRETKSKGGRDARRDVRNTGRLTCVSQFFFHLRGSTPRGQDAPGDHQPTRPRRRPRMSDTRDLTDATIPASRRSAREILRRRSRPMVQGKVKSRACAVDGRARAAYAQTAKEAWAPLQLFFKEKQCKYT